MKAHRGISYYIGSRLLLLFAAFVLCYSFIANHVYLWGMDESTNYYMFAEADLVLEQYKPGQEIADHIEGYREYYWPNELPQKYLDLFDTDPDKLNYQQLHTTDEASTYFIAVGDKSIELYVLHILPGLTGTEDSTVSIRKLLILAALASLLALVLLTGWFVYRLVNTITTLSAWAGRINADQPDSMQVPDKAIYFKELYLLGQKLADSFSELARVNEREQQFLRSLSHELRTPIAVTSAALDVLDKKVEEPKLAKLTARIRRASNTMRSLTETILWLWREPENDKPRQSTALSEIVEQMVSDNQYLLKSKAVVVETQVDADLLLAVEPTLLTIVCNNLIRNAFQHCDDGKVVIQGETGQLTVSNSYREDDEVEAGFGLGLLIVQRIVDNYGWQLTIAKDETFFTVIVAF